MNFVIKTSLFLTFVCGHAFAQSTYYSTPVSELKVYTSPKCDINPSHVNSCVSMTSDKLSKDAIIWDCGKTNKNGECSYEKHEVVNTSTTLPMSQVEYYYFNDVVTDLGDGKPVNVCEQEDPVHGETYKDVVYKILLTGNQQKLSKAKILEQIDRYLSKKTYTQVEDPVSGKKTKKRIFRSECFVHDRGWVFSNFLTKIGNADPNTLTNTQANCDGECKSAVKSAVQTLMTDMDRVLKDLDHNDKIDRKASAAIIDKCQGSLELQNVTIKFEKTKQGCNITFPEGCTARDRLLKFEELSNNILFNATQEAEKKCRDVDFAFRNQCGLNPGLHGNKEKQYKRFSEVRAKVQSALKDEKKKSNISEGIMMCLFNIETTNYDASKVNYTVCDPTYVDQHTNLKNRKKLGVSKPTDYIFKGSRSSAHGLGQVTLEQACFTVRANPHNYPSVKNADKLNCGAPEGKRAVQDLFLNSAADESIQIQLSLDTLREKWNEAGKHMPTAVKYYNGDDKNGTFVNFVTSCSACFNKTSKNKNLSDEDIHRCVLATRNRILNTNKDDN